LAHLGRIADSAWRWLASWKRTLIRRHDDGPVYEFTAGPTSPIWAARAIIGSPAKLDYHAGKVRSGSYKK
jgi:hypothetical protein